MRRVHIIGGKNHGKTTLIGELVTELRDRGLRVGTIKHTHHQHELDTPGKDSYRHREAGAQVVGILSRSLNAVFWKNEEPAGPSSPADDRYAAFAPAFAECDLVLVEGNTLTTAPKLEVWRAALETPSIAERIEGVHAVITDDPRESHVATHPRADVKGIADLILQLVP